MSSTQSVQSQHTSASIDLPNDMSEQEARDALTTLIENDNPLADQAQWLLQRL